nr:hypothetical protein CFP56_72484 [Quercus suber]
MAFKFPIQSTLIFSSSKFRLVLRTRVLHCKGVLHCKPEATWPGSGARPSLGMIENALSVRTYVKLNSSLYLSAKPSRAGLVRTLRSVQIVHLSGRFHDGES